MEVFGRKKLIRHSSDPNYNNKDQELIKNGGSLRGTNDAFGILWDPQSPYTFDDTSKQPAILGRDETMRPPSHLSCLMPESNLLHTLIINTYLHINVFKRLSSAKEPV